MSISEQQKQVKKKVSPTLSRKFDAQSNRYIVRLKPKQWNTGIMLHSDGPLGLASPLERLFAANTDEHDEYLKKKQQSEKKTNQKEKEDTNEVNDNPRAEENSLVERKKAEIAEKAERDADASATTEEKNRIVRYHESISKNHSYEEIIIDEIARSRAEKANKKSMDSVDEMVHYLSTVHSYRHYMDSTKTSRENLSQLFRTRSFPIRGFFSGLDHGHGFYPILGHVRREPMNSGKVNCCVWFQQGNAMLYPLQTLYQDDEIVVADDEFLLTSNSLRQQLVDMSFMVSRASTLERMKSWMSEHLPLVNQVHGVVKQMIYEILESKTLPIAYIPMLIKLQFFQGVFDWCFDSFSKDNDKKKLTKEEEENEETNHFLQKAGIKNLELATAYTNSDMVNEKPISETDKKIYSFMSGIGIQRISLVDLFDLLRNDRDVLTLHKIWFEHHTLQENGEKKNQLYPETLDRVWTRVTKNLMEPLGAALNNFENSDRPV